MTYTPRHRTITPSEIQEAKEWVYEMYRMADAKNVGMVAIFMNDDAVLNFANAPPLQGRAALERLYIWEYGACPRISHSIREIRVQNNQIRVKLAITYSFRNGAQHAMDCVAVWHKFVKDKKASCVDVNGDFAQVLQELTAVAGPPPFQ